MTAVDDRLEEFCEAIDELRCRGSVCGELELAAGFTGDRDCQVKMIRWKATADSIGPFDQRDAVAEPVVGSQVEKLVFRAQTVGVGMMDRKTGVVVLQQHEGRAADVTRRTAKPVDNAADEKGFPGTKFSGDGHNKTGVGKVAESMAQAMRLSFGIGVVGPGRHG